MEAINCNGQLSAPQAAAAAAVWQCGSCVCRDSHVGFPGPLPPSIWACRTACASHAILHPRLHTPSSRAKQAGFAEGSSAGSGSSNSSSHKPCCLGEVRGAWWAVCGGRRMRGALAPLGGALAPLGCRPPACMPCGGGTLASPPSCPPGIKHTAPRVNECYGSGVLLHGTHPARCICHTHAKGPSSVHT